MCHLPQGYFKHLLVASTKHPQTVIINEKVIKCRIYQRELVILATLSYAFIIYFPESRPLGHRQGTQWDWYSFGISFFPVGKGSCLVLETTLLDHGDMPMGFVQVFVSSILH